MRSCRARAWHVVHVAFGALYLVPIVAAFPWIGPGRGKLDPLALATLAAVVHGARRGVA
jgi:hypothetical protein